MENNSTKKSVVYWLRWLVTFPGGLLVGFVASLIASFPIHWTLSLKASGNSEGVTANNFETIELAIVSFVFAAAYIHFGTKIAPTNKKFETAIGLILAVVLLVIVLATAYNFTEYRITRMLAVILGLVFGTWQAKVNSRLKPNDK